MYSAIRNDDYIVLSISPKHLIDALKVIGKCDINFDEFSCIITPKNIDIISFVNDLAIKNKIASKYMITTDIESYHPNDYVWHQSKYSNNICNVIIKDNYDDVLMGSQYDAGAEECPGTKKIADTYISAYDTTQKKILNKSSLYIRSGGGIFSIIERNLNEFLTYLSWVKLNECVKIVKARNPESNVDLASTFEIIQRTDGTVFDIIRKLKESKDTSFYMLDGKTGKKIKMMVDSNIPDAESDTTEEYYHAEFVNNLAAFREGTVGTLTSAIRSADARIKRSMSVGVRTGLQLALTLQKQGWKQKTVSGVECMVYSEKVYVTSVVGNDGKRYQIPDDCKELMYLYDITVPIDSTLHGLGDDRMGVKARGFHPHRGSGGESNYTEHIRVKDLNRICIGDLDGKPIEKITELIESLSGAYQPSMMGNMPSRCISYLFGNDFSAMIDKKNEDAMKMMEYLEPLIKHKGLLKGAKPVSKTDKVSDEEPKMKSAVKGASIFTTT